MVLLPSQGCISGAGCEEFELEEAMAEKDLEAETAQNDRPWGHRWGFSDTRFVLNDDGSVTLTGNRYDLA